jgi:two-component system, response regulator RegA
VPTTRISPLRSVLVVEDNLRLAEAVREWVAAKYACQVRTAASLDQCRRLLREDYPDLIVLDVELADSDAFDVLDALDGSSPMPRVVIVSGAARPRDAFRLAQLGVREYLQKPLDTSLLELAIERALTESPLLEPHLRAAVGHIALGEVEALVRQTMVHEALARSSGSRRAAARVLSVSRQVLQHMLRKLEPAQRARP